MSKHFFFGLWAVVLVLAGGLASCKKSDVPDEENVRFTLSFSEEEVTLEEGKSKNLENLLVIEPASVADTLKVTYSCSSKKVAKVSETGRVKALYEGRAVVTASAYGQSAEIKIKVKPVVIQDFAVPGGTVEAIVNVPVALEIGVTPENASPGHLQLSVSPEGGQLELDDNVWYLTLPEAGNYTVTVQSGEIVRTIRVEAKAVPVTSVVLSRYSALLQTGTTLQLTASVLPENATYQTLVWSSNNTAALTVSQDGLCSARQKGKAVVTVTAVGGQTATCSLTVTDEDVSKIHLFGKNSGRPIRFSPGNLQYSNSGSHACADGTTKPGKWRFAPRQYDVIGNGNSSISSTYTGWIDLFGGGTSGYAVEPYTSSTSGLGYKKTDGYNEWGAYNAIVRGDAVDEPGTWRCFSQGDMYTILESRENASNLYGVGRVDNVNGVILLPDDWVLPAGVTFTPGKAANEGSAYYAGVNNYTAQQWSKMEEAGAVFLPEAGYRTGTSFTSTPGRYWTLSNYPPSDSGQNYSLDFTSNSVDCRTHHYREYGYAVRLVQDF